MIAAICGLFTAIVLYRYAAVGIGIFIAGSASSALAHGAGYLQTVSLFYLICFIGAIYQGFLRGAGILDIQYYGTTMQIAVRVILTWLFVDSLGLSAVAWATGIGWLLIWGYQLLYFRRRGF